MPTSFNVISVAIVKGAFPYQIEDAICYCGDILLMGKTLGRSRLFVLGPHLTSKRGFVVMCGTCLMYDIENMMNSITYLHL